MMHIRHRAIAIFINVRQLSFNMSGPLFAFRFGAHSLHFFCRRIRLFALAKIFFDKTMGLFFRIQVCVKIGDRSCMWHKKITTNNVWAVYHETGGVGRPFPTVRCARRPRPCADPSRAATRGSRHYLLVQYPNWTSTLASSQLEI